MLGGSKQGGWDGRGMRSARERWELLLGDIDVDGSLVIQYILRKNDMSMWLVVRVIGVLLWTGNEPLGFCKSRGMFWSWDYNSFSRMTLGIGVCLIRDFGTLFQSRLTFTILVLCVFGMYGSRFGVNYEYEQKMVMWKRLLRAMRHNNGYLKLFMYYTARQKCNKLFHLSFAFTFDKTYFGPKWSSSGALLC